MEPTRPPRKRLRRRAGPGARYLTFSCYRRLPLLGTARIRDRFVEAIAAAREVERFELIAWVVMPGRVHMIPVPGPGHPVRRVLAALKRPFADAVIGRWRELGAAALHRITDEHGRSRFWQPGGGFDRNVRDQTELCREITYIHENPVERGLAARPTDWPWSSALWYSGRREGALSIDRPWDVPLNRFLERERNAAERGRR